METARSASLDGEHEVYSPMLPSPAADAFDTCDFSGGLDLDNLVARSPKQRDTFTQAAQAEGSSSPILFPSAYGFDMTTLSDDLPSQLSDPFDTQGFSGDLDLEYTLTQVVEARDGAATLPSPPTPAVPRHFWKAPPLTAAEQSASQHAPYLKDGVWDKDALAKQSPRLKCLFGCGSTEFYGYRSVSRHLIEHLPTKDKLQAWHATCRPIPLRNGSTFSSALAMTVSMSAQATALGARTSQHTK